MIVCWMGCRVGLNAMNDWGWVSNTRLLGPEQTAAME
jgi:hypothetical protein